MKHFGTPVCDGHFINTCCSFVFFVTSKPLREFLHVTNTELKDELITVRWLKKKRSLWPQQKANLKI